MDQLAPHADRPTRVRWLVFFLGCAASWLLYLHRYSWSVVKGDVKKEYGLSDGQLGWIDSAFQVTYAIGQTPLGFAGDLLGPRGMLTFMILLWSVLVAAFAGTTGMGSMIAVRNAFGLAQAGTYPVLSQVTRRWFPLTVRTSVQGWVAALGRVGGGSASLIVGTILMGLLAFDWRTSLILLALPGPLLALAIFLTLRSSPKEHPWCNDAERALVEDDTAPAASGAKPALRLDRATVLTLVMLCIYSFHSTFADQLFVNWIPLYLEEEKKLTKVQMGVFAMLPLLGGAAGSIAGGMLNDVLLRHLRRRRARFLVAFAGKLLAGLLIAASVFVADGRVVMGVLFFCKFFGDWSLPTLWGAITDVSGRGAGTVFGLVNTIGTVGGFVAGPSLGYLKQAYGWNGLFFAVAGVFILSALTWFFIDSERRLMVEVPSQ